jgi:hypothetical protein
VKKVHKEASKAQSPKLDREDGGIAKFHEVEKRQCVNSADK